MKHLKQSGHLVIAGLLILAILFGTKLFFPQRNAVTTQQLENAIHNYLEKGIFVTFDPSSNFGVGASQQYFKNALALLRDKYDRKDIRAIAINEPINNEFVNIYLFDDVQMDHLFLLEKTVLIRVTVIS